MWKLLDRLASRRQEPRFALPVAARIWIRGQPTPATSEDISASGIRLHIASPHVFRPDEHYVIEIDLPTQGGTVRTDARVVRIDKELSDGWLISFRFSEMKAEDRERIAALQNVASKPVDRRSEVRLAACISARVSALGTAIPAYTKDISAAGIRLLITSHCRFEVGERYQMEIDLPGERSSVKLSARVTRATREAAQAEKQDIAFLFVQVGERDQARIRNFVYRKEIEHRRLGLR